MGQIRGLKCFTNGRNTGRAGCPLVLSHIKGDVLVPYDFNVPVAAGDSDATIVAAVIAAIQTAMKHNTFALRAQLIGKYISFEDKSEAATVVTQGYGKKNKVNDGVYVHEHTYDNGGLDYHTAVRYFDGKEDDYKLIRISETGVLHSANQYDGTGALIGVQGLELDNINVYPVKGANYGAPAEYRVGWTFTNTSEQNEDSFAIATGINIFTLLEQTSVVDLTLVPFTATSARVHPFMIKTLNGSVNVADTLGTLLNDPTAIVAVNKTSGVAIAVTSVALNTLTKKYVVTFTAGAGYVASQVALVNLGSVSALHALGADYYDGSTIVEITMA